MARELTIVAWAVGLAMLGTAWGDTFTNKATGQVLKGTLVRTVGTGGQKEYLVKLENGQQNCLPAWGWDVQKEANPAVEPPKPAPQAPGRTYLGKRRAKAWFDEMYRKFADKIALVDGKYVDICKAALEDDYFSDGPNIAPLKIGGWWLRFKVLSIINESELLIHREALPTRPGHGGSIYEGLPERLLHLRGVNTEKLVDGAEVTDKLVPGGIVRIGRYEYGAASGARKFVPSYTHCGVLTKEEFAEALEQGFKLVEYRKVTAPEKGKSTVKVVATPVQ